MYWADPPRPPRQELRPVVGESSPPAAGEVRSAHRPGPPAPSRAQNRVRHTCMRGVGEPCTRASHPHRPAPPMQPQMPPAPAIPLLPAALLKASRNLPPTFVPRAAPPCRQTMKLDSIVAYILRLNRWCGATRGGFSFSRSFFRSQMCRVGRRRHRPWGRRAARSADFLLFVRERVLCESNNMIELHNPLCTRTHGTHVPRRVISHRCTHTP